ncbi:MAG: AAA family ATPase, partial [Bacteroidota bacterium]
DFETPMRGGLFGIFGPTGSGKSTILDAMTLALYGKVQRGTQGIINMAESRCSVAFTFEIGGGGERQTYTIDRLLARSKSGGIETKKMRLMEHHDGKMEPVSEKNSELKEIIQGIIGINFDDFLRAVVLPQGAFAEFLSLESRERSAVLQRLFNLHHFGDRLSIQLKQRQTEMQKGRAEVEGRMHELKAYDDEAVTAHEQAEGLAADHLAAIRGEVIEQEKLHADLLALHDLLAEQRALQADVETWRLREDEVRALRSQIERADRGRLVEPAINALDLAAQRHAESDARHRESVRQNDLIIEELAAARLLFDRAVLDYPAVFNVLCEEIAELEAIRREESRLSRNHERLQGMNHELASLLRSYKEMDAEHRIIAADVEAMERLMLAWEREAEELMIAPGERAMLAGISRLLQSLAGVGEQIARKEEEIHQLELTISSDRITSGAADREELAAVAEVERIGGERDRANAEQEKARAAQEGLRDRYVVLKGVLSDIDAQEELARTHEADRKSQEERLPGLRRTLDQEMLHLREARSHESNNFTELENIRHLRDDARRKSSLASLLLHLHDGSPCLLCGSPDHPAPHVPDESIATEIESLDAELARLEGKVRECEITCRHIERSVSATENALEAATANLESLAAKRDAVRARIEELLGSVAAAPPIATSDALRSLIDTVIAEGTIKTASVESLSARLHDLEALSLKAERERSRIAEQRAGRDAELARDRERLERELIALRHLREQRGSISREITDLSDGRTVAYIEERFLEIARHDHALAETRARIAAKREELGTSRLNLARIEMLREEGRRKSTDAESDARALEGEIVRQTTEVSSRIAELVPEDERRESVEMLISGRAERRDGIKEEFDRAKLRHDAAHTEAKVKQGAVDDAWKGFHREEIAWKEADRVCRERLIEHGFADPGEVRESLLHDDELRALRSRAEQIALEHERRTRRMEELSLSIAGRGSSDEELREREEALSDARKMEESATLALGGAREKLRECREKNQEWRKVSLDDRESAGRLATMDQLGRYIRANAFVDYLANERLVEICRRASVQLATLTGGRLAIGARPKDGFYIQDNGNGGGERAPSTLSGGETFLVSLSLALALSDTIQMGRAPLEFFFLDEGFGTLDNDLLDTVMNSLDRLRSEHRAIGVISHVAQLRERIPRRLIITPADERRGSTVRYEMV